MNTSVQDFIFSADMTNDVASDGSSIISDMRGPCHRKEPAKCETRKHGKAAERLRPSQPIKQLPC